MPWTSSDFPDAMKNLPREVRNKALLEDKKMEEGIFIAIAISRSQDWVANSYPYQ